MSVLERVDVRDFLGALGIEVATQSGDNLLFCCPFHSEVHPSARMNFKTTAWLCSVGCGQGNAIHFLSMLRQMPFEEARNHIYSRYGIGPGAPIADLESEVRRNLLGFVEAVDRRVAPHESWVEYLSIDWEVDGGHPAAEYMGGRGFDPDVLARWQVGFDPASARVAIPVRDHLGALVGFKGRTIDPDRLPRYLVLGDNRPDQHRYGFNTYRKSEYVFGLDRWDGRQRHAYVVEGELNAIAMREYHDRFALGIAGVEFSDRQRELIATRFESVTVMLDDDELKLQQPGNEGKVNAGRRGAAKVAAALLPFIHVDVVLHAYEDPVDLIGRPADMDELTSAAAPAMRLAIDEQLDLVVST